MGKKERSGMSYLDIDHGLGAFEVTTPIKATT
jgi:hypothetical protein